MNAAILLISLSIPCQTEPKYVPVLEAKPGTTLFAWVPGAADVMVATDPFAFRDVIKSIAANDDEGLKELRRSGRLFLVRSETPVKVLQSRREPIAPAPCHEVRVLDGDAKNRTGWVHAAWVRAKVTDQPQPKPKAKPKRRR